MFNNDVWRPGAVDVDDGIGLVRHGMIRDLIPSSGLVIDFGYSYHHADLIPFSQCTTVPRKAKVTQPNSLETLFQRSPDQPWCWYPTELLSGSLDTSAFVEIDFEGEVLRDVIELERVRPLREDRRFRKHEVELPEMEQELMTATKREGFLRRWNWATETVGVTIDSERLTYISQDPSPMTGDVIVNHGICNETTRGKKRTADGDIISSSAGEPEESKTIEFCPCNINSALPVDILLKIFSFLDVDDQIHSRSVCAMWNSILTSRLASCRVQLYLSDSSAEELAFALHKMVTGSTKILVLMGNHDETSFTHNPLHVVWDLMKAKSMKIGTIVLARRCVWADDLLQYCYGSGINNVFVQLQSSGPPELVPVNYTEFLYGSLNYRKN